MATMEAGAGERVHDSRVSRGFAFVDLSGFTRYTDTNGDGAAVAVLSDFRATVRDIAARRGVRIAKWLGDGAMLVGVETEILTEAVVEIEEVFTNRASPLALRAGIAQGPVILFEGDDYIGAAVNLAARLCEKARPGEVLAPAAMISSLMVNIEATPIGSASIEGFGEPIDLVTLRGARG